MDDHLKGPNTDTFTIQAPYDVSLPRAILKQITRTHMREDLT